MIDIEWVQIKKKIDRKYKGSIWEKLGYDKELCPRCKTHLHKGICLNACHLTSSSRQRFASLINDATQLRAQPTGGRRGTKRDK